MLTTLLNRSQGWMSATGPESDVVVGTRVTLLRNLADYPFPGQCSNADKQAVLDRIKGALDNDPLFSDGQFCRGDEMDECEARALVERHLATDEWATGTGPGGIFVADDGGMSVVVNGANHVAIHALGSGLQPKALWTRVAAADRALAGRTDFAFDERYGYLTSELSTLGTGLLLTAVLHLSGLALDGKAGTLPANLREEWHELVPVLGESAGTGGDLYEFSNAATLGRSEEELVYNLQHRAQEIARLERDARGAILREGPRVLEDRVGRALGIAREARLLESDEALALVSSLRLGVTAGLLEGHTLDQLNELLVTSQRGHIELKQGHECDDLTLSMERADLFRARFS